MSTIRFGSVSPRVYFKELPEAAAVIVQEALVVRPCCFALADIEETWEHVDVPGERTVVVM